MPKTLLTGANGFVAAHILDQLVAAGHTVVGSVRSEAKGQEILDAHPSWASNVSFVVVSDYAAPGTWDKTFQENDFDYVLHTAAPLLDDPRNTDFDRDFLDPSVKGAVELLKSAQKYGKSLKSVVVTGSVNAMTTGADADVRVFSSESWLPLTSKEAREMNNAYISYCVAKKEAEEAIWDFVKSASPHFSVTVLLPALIFGPPIQPISSVKKMNYSTDVLYSLINGTYETVPPTSFASFVDVRDLAAAHLLSLSNPAVANKRLPVGGNTYSSQLAVDGFKTIPELKSRVPQINSDEVKAPVKFSDVVSWNEKLGLKLREPMVTFADTGRRLLELEKVVG